MFISCKELTKILDFLLFEEQGVASLVNAR